MKRAVEQLRSLERLHEVLTVSTIVEEIVYVGVTDRAAEALKTMDERHFDVLGLCENGRIVAYLEKRDLEGGGDLAEAVCGSFRRDWESAELVAESCSLADCMAKLREKQRLFVHTTQIVHGIVTQADLHKQPVRMLLFSVISLLEMALLSLIQETYSEEKEWTPLLSPSRLAAANGLQRKREDAGLDIDLADCLQLVDKGTIVKKTESLRTALGLGNKRHSEKFFLHLDGVRNALAHGAAFEDVPQLTWAEVFNVFDKARDVLCKSVHVLGGEKEALAATDATIVCGSLSNSREG